MRRLLLGTLLASVLAAVVAAPLTAEAGFIVEGSLGKGRVVEPSSGWTQTNVMVSPGLTFIGSILRLQLGIAADMPDGDKPETDEFDLQLRPMLTIKPPLLPIHARAIFAVQNIVDDVRVAYGGAAGLNLSLFGIGVFAEAGLLPTSINSTINWVVEARIGASVGF
jgi:hypothetical protein